jgi:hypothetical protein
MRAPYGLNIIDHWFMLRSIEPVWVGMKSGAWPRKRAFERLAGGCLGATCDPVLALEVRR